MTENGMRLASRGMMTLGRLIHLFVATVVIFSLAYLLGHTMLTGLKGGDSALHVAYATWLNQYFPSIPHWYPLQGGGVSLLHGYPLLSHMMVVALHRLSELSILQAYQLISFLTFPLTAMGVYLFCWVAFRRQTVGLIAAVLYLLAPITWTWAYDWGFFAQTVAMVFLPLGLLCFDRYFSHLLKETRSRGQRIWFALLVLLVVVTMLTHPIVGAGLLGAMALYSLGSALAGPSGRRMHILTRSISATLFTGIFAGLLLAFYLVPFYRYGQVANREGLNNLPLHLVNRIPIAEFFGLQPVDPKYVLTRMANPLVTTAMFVAGIPFAVRYSRKAGALAFVVVAAAVYSLWPEIPYMLSIISSSLVAVFGRRSILVVVMVLYPVGAALGVWSIARSIVSPTALLRRRASAQVGGTLPRLSLRGFAASGLALALAGVAILQLGEVFPAKDYHVSYGPLAHGIDLRSIWGRRASDSCNLPPDNPGRLPICDVPEARASLNIQEFYRECDGVRSVGFPVPALCDASSPTGGMVAEFLGQCQDQTDLGGAMAPCRARSGTLIAQLAPESWPAFALSDQDPPMTESQRLAALLPDDSSLRIDVSPYLGRLAQDVTAFSSASQINAYTYTLSLVHAMWGYQQSVFYSDTPVAEYGNPRSLNALAQWFGTEYVFLHSEEDSIERYEDAGWELVHLEDTRELWRFPDAPGMATVTSRPAILVVGRPESDAYSVVFRLANDGMLPYEEAILVEGQPRVDRYTLEDLKPFDALFLYGYDYGNSRKAWDTLAAYVDQGGSLFVDTGWEFWIPEWEFERAPEVLPVDTLTWTDYGTVAHYQVEVTEIAGEIDAGGFAPLVWQGVPWGVSGANRDEVRDWGEVVLSAAGRPLIVAGEYGNGRVVWSGMNLVGHASGQKNEEELRLVHNLIAWLVGGNDGGEYPVSVKRDYPDRVDFSVEAPARDTTWLYWREAYYPAWHAYLETEDGVRQELPIYRGGPGFMLMPIEEGASGNVSVELVWETPLIERLAALLSLVTVLALGAFVLDSLFLGGGGFAALQARLRWSRHKPKPQGTVEWLSDRAPTPPAQQEVVSSHGETAGHEPAPSDVEEVGASIPTAVESELHLSEDVEALWRQWVESRDVPSAQERDSDRMIARWRRSRETGENG